MRLNLDRPGRGLGDAERPPQRIDGISHWPAGRVGPLLRAHVCLVRAADRLDQMQRLQRGSTQRRVKFLCGGSPLARVHSFPKMIRRAMSNGTPCFLN